MKKIKKKLSASGKSFLNFLKIAWNFILEGGHKAHMPKLKRLKKSKNLRKIVGGILTVLFIVALVFGIFILFEGLAALVFASFYGIATLIKNVLFPNSGLFGFFSIFILNFVAFFGIIIYVFSKGKLIKKIQDFYEN